MIKSSFTIHSPYDLHNSILNNELIFIVTHHIRNIQTINFGKLLLGVIYMQSKEHYWGKLIKFHRLDQQLKQDDLAVGICTSSYLSRIENGVVIAEQQIYEQLLARLGLDLKEQEAKEYEHIQFLEDIYERLLSNEEVAELEIEKIISFQHNNSFLSEAVILSKLVYSRYLLSIHLDLEARQLLSATEPFITWQFDRVTQMYVAITAFAHLSFWEFKELAIREEQQHLGQYLGSASSFEQANYEYHLAFANHRNSNFSQALAHIEKASSLFTHQYKPLFQLKLFSMKGVIYNDLHCYKEAIMEFEAGIDLLTHVVKIQSPLQWSSIYNNLAYCYECQGNLKQAMIHYEQANSHMEDPNSLINWMRTSYQFGDVILLNQLLVKYPEQYFPLQHQKYQRQLLEYVNNNEELKFDLLKQLEERIFPYFEEREYYSLTLYYAPLWGSLYEQLHSYKHASNCYKTAFNASELVRQRMNS